jgi:hypothetical protein
MAGSIAVLMDLHAVEVLYCMAGANLPDQMEKIGRFRIADHRTWTHELLLWLTPLVLLQCFPHFLPAIPRVLSLSTPGHALQDVLVFRTGVFFLPGVLHLSGDILTPGGILVAGKKVKMALFRTGQFAEYLVAGLFVLLAILHKMDWMHLIFKV